MMPQDLEPLTAAARSGSLGTVDGLRSAPEREVLWEASEGLVAITGTLLLCTLLAWLVLPALFGLYRVWQVRCHRYVLTDQRLSEQQGIFMRDTQQLELYRVRDIAVSEPLLQRLFGRGRVTLFTSDQSSPVVHLNAIGSPHAVSHLIRQRVEACRVAKGVRQIDA